MQLHQHPAAGNQRIWFDHLANLRFRTVLKNEDAAQLAIIAHRTGHQQFSSIEHLPDIGQMLLL